jgi:hypothetical protein
MICIPEGQCPSFLSPALQSTSLFSAKSILFRPDMLCTCQGLDIRRLRGLSRSQRGRRQGLQRRIRPAQMSRRGICCGGGAGEGISGAGSARVSHLFVSGGLWREAPIVDVDGVWCDCHWLSFGSSIQGDDGESGARPGVMKVRRKPPSDQKHKDESPGTRLRQRTSQ